jgi:WD40 repeat protein
MIAKKILLGGLGLFLTCTAGCRPAAAAESATGSNAGAGTLTTFVAPATRINAMPSAVVSSASVRPSPTGTGFFPPTFTPTATPLDDSAEESIVAEGYVPQGAIARLGRGTINWIALSPDGSLLAAAGATGLSVFAAGSFEEIWSVPTTEPMTRLAFSADGARLTAYSFAWKSGGVNCGCFLNVLESVHTWNVADHSLFSSLALNYSLETSYAALSVELSSDGQFLEVGDPDRGQIDVWDLSAGSLWRSLTLPNPFQGAALSGDGSRAAVYFGNSVSLVDVNSGAETAAYEEPDGLDGLAFSPDGKTLVELAGWNVVVRDIQTGSLIRKMEYRKSLLPGWTVSNDGRWVAAVTYAGTRVLLDTQTGSIFGGTEPPAWEGRARDAFRNLIFDPDGKSIWSAKAAGIDRLKIQSMKIEQSLSNPFSSFADGRLESDALLAREPGKVRAFGIDAWQPQKEYAVPMNVVMSDDLRRYADFQPDQGLAIKDARTGAVLSVIPKSLIWWTSPMETLDYFIFSPGSDLAAVVRDRSKEPEPGVDVFPIQSPGKSRFFPCPATDSNGPCYAVFSPGNTYVGLGSYGEWGEEFYVYALADGRKIGEFSDWEKFNLAFSNDDSEFASTCSISTEDASNICFYQAMDGKMISLVKQVANKGGLSASAFSPDGKRFAYGTDLGIVFAFDPRKGLLLNSFPGHTAAIRKISFSPDGKTLASTSADGTIVVWSLEG